MSESGFAATLLAPELPCSPGLRAWNGSDPVKRLAVYRNNVTSSLIDALACTFPVCQELVGIEFFRAMASWFVRQYPPRTRVLAHYGAELPAFIEAFEPAGTVPYLADVARLEQARVLAYHAADADPVAPEVVSAALSSGEDLGSLRLMCHPSVRVLASRFAIVSIWAAHQGEGELSDVDPALPESALVLRDGLEVLVLSLPPGGATFIAAILLGSALAEAAARAAGECDEFDLPAVLTLLMRHGGLTSLHTPRSLPQ
jgi:Putative DNA-binding domain